MTEFTSSDLDEVQRFVSSTCSSLRIGEVGPNLSIRIVRHVAGPALEFDDLDFNVDVEYDADSADRLIICDVVTGTVRRDGDEHSQGQVFGAGEQFLICRPGLPHGGLVRGARLRFTLLGPAALSRAVAARATDGATHRPVQLTSPRPLSVAARVRMQQAIAHTRRSLTAVPDDVAAPLLVASATQYLAAHVLGTYPNDAVASSGVHERGLVSPPAVARAIAYIEANPDQPLTLADIAAAAYISPRGLQIAFRRELDVTPMAHLRRVRLDLARNELTDGTPGTTVGTVAARWGFSASAFAHHYHAAYAELPSHTLRTDRGAGSA